MTNVPRQQNSSLPPCRTRCTILYMVILQQARPEVHHRLLDKAYSYSFTIRPVKDFKDAVNAARNR